MADPIKIQETADNLHISIYEMPDGNLHHFKGVLPKGAKLYTPTKPLVTAVHGKEQQEAAASSDG